MKQIKLIFMMAIMLMPFTNLTAQQAMRKTAASNVEQSFTRSHVSNTKPARKLTSVSGKLLPASISGYYSEGFEGSFPPAGWQVIDVQDPAILWTQSTLSPYEGSNSAYIGYTFPQGTIGEDWLIMPQFTCVATDSLSFYLMPQFVGYPPDETTILVSTTGTALNDFTNVIATLTEGVNYPATTNYQYYSYDLSAFAGQDIYVAFRNINDYGDGIFIDKVSIGTKPAINAQAVSIDFPAFVSTAINSPLATVKNDGIAPATFDVTMTITGGYTSTKTVTSLIAGGTQQVTFDPWSPFAGNVVVSIETLLAGDGVTYDDTLSKTVMVLDEFVNYGWRIKSSMTGQLFGCSPSSINSNDTSYLYSGGGSTSTGTITINALKYQPYNSLWVNLPSMPMATFIPGSFSWQNKLFYIGGYNPFFSALANVQIYDLTTGIWSAGAAIPIPVGDFAGGLYNDSLYYVCGGYDGTADQNSVQIYNPANNTWTPGTPMPADGAAWRGGISGNKIVVTGGYNQNLGSTLSATYVGTIDPSVPSQITWVQADDYPGGPAARLGGCGVLDQSTGLVVFTGGDPDGGGVNTMGVTFGFDVNSNSWKIGPDKPTAVSNLANMTNIVDDDSLYVVAVGGYDGGNASGANEWLNLGPYTLPVSVNEVSGLSAFSIYPNPVGELAQITFNLKKNSQVKILLSDVAGKVYSSPLNEMQAAGSHTVTVNTSKLAQGLYIITIEVDGIKSAYKLLK